MLSQLQSLFNKLSENKASDHRLSVSELQLATAALMVEVATIDQQFDNVELSTLRRQLDQQFSLSKDALDALTQQATEASKEASSLYEFTQLINQHCNDDEKYLLACDLWRIAYADGKIDKYEEHIIRRIADLIYLRHSDFIRAKHEIRDGETAQ